MTITDRTGAANAQERSVVNVPFHRPEILEEDIEAVSEALRSGWLTHGPITRRFEEAFADDVGAEFAVAVSSGTAAMHLSLVGLGIGEGSTVITSPFTFCATAHVIEHAGARPRFVDVEPETLQIDPRGVADAIDATTKALLPVHYGGHPAAMGALRHIADEHDLVVVEDAAHALGASIDGRPIGAVGESVCFSFYATKNITTGEGGMVTTDDATLAKRLQELRLHGISRDAWNRYGADGDWFYDVAEPGFKANLTDIQAALGLSQLGREASMRQRRERVALRYLEALEPLTDRVQLPTVQPGVTSAWHLFPIRLRPGSGAPDRAAFVERLRSSDVATSVHFIPLHLQSHFRNRYGYGPGDFPNAEAAYSQIVSLPIFPGMTDAEIEHVIRGVSEALAAGAGT
jgi:dTDP-4-amino-4,6-dideoxygalactose transaminase